MKKYQIILPLIVLFLLFACTEDESAYTSQQKENVKVDQVVNEDEGNDDEELPEGQLVPGMHVVKLEVAQPDGKTMERRFKYYMPISIDASKPIPLIFEFHGSYEFDAGVQPPNPLNNVGVANVLAQNAIQTNSIICYPAGEVVYSTDSSGYVNWMNSENNLPFVDAMIDYFGSCTPTIDPVRIYSTGQSSGAIFSFVLAFERSEVFAAIAPRAGQMSLSGQTGMPSRAVPVRVFAGEEDDIVNHNAVIDNMTAWAEKIGGYFASDMQMDSLTIEDYTDVTIRYWRGARTDLEIYSLTGVGHGVSLDYCLPYMWNFMKSHTLDALSGNLYVTGSLKEIEAQCGESYTIRISYPDDAAVSVSTPKGWTLTVDDKVISFTAPQDFYGNISRKGELQITVSRNGQTANTSISYSLKAPKDYFEIGDIYYNENFEPVGVVYWVNDENIREAKVINLEQVSREIGDFGNDFSTPDLDDGAANTASCVTRNVSEALGLTPSNSGVIWAAEYSYKGVGTWYLPAINEWLTIHANRVLINEVLASIGGVALGPSGYYISSTVVSENGSKNYYELNFSSGAISKETSMYADLIRAIKKVTK